MVPGPWSALILVLGAYRLTRLLGWDDLPFLRVFREWVSGAEETGDRRPLVAHLLGCAFCLGWWVSVAVYAAWLAVPRVTLYVMAPFALGAAVGLIAKNLDP